MKKITFSKKEGKLSRIALELFDELNYSALMKALRNKDVKVNGKRVSKDCHITKSDMVEIYFAPTNAEKFSVVFSNDDVVVVDKKSGFSSESVYEDLLAKNKNCKFIHRLDRNTSGLMIFALNEKSEKELLSGFKKRTFEKYYLAEVIGAPKENEKILTAYLFKDAKNSKVKIYPNAVKGSVKIVTGYKVVKRSERTSTLLVTLYTGKTHQIRAHLAYIGNAIVGDGKYGDNDFNKEFGAKSQMLTASKLVLHFDTKSPLNYLDGKVFEL